MVVEKKLYTVDEFEDFLALPENDDRLFELIEGEIVEKLPTEEHGLIAGNFYAALRDFAKPRKLGRVVIEVRYRKQGDDYNARQPDVSFTRAERLLPVVKQGAVPQLPDLAIEVQSPDDSIKRMRAKADYLLANGVSMVCLAYTKKRLVEVRHANGDADILTIEDTLDGGDVLPGFKMAVTAIFDIWE